MRFTRKYVKSSDENKRWVKVDHTDADFVDVKKLCPGLYRCIDKDDNCLILKIQ